MISNIHIFSVEDRAAEVENNTEIFYSDGTAQTNAATSSAGIGYNPKALSLSCQKTETRKQKRNLNVHVAGEQCPCSDCVYAETTASSLKKHKGSEHELIHNKQAEISDKSLWHTPDTTQVIKRAINSTMTHEAVNAFAVKEEISEVVEEETSAQSVKESHSFVMQEESGSVGSCFVASKR